MAGHTSLLLVAALLCPSASASGIAQRTEGEACGKHLVVPGQTIVVRGSDKYCTWTVIAAAGGRVGAMCQDVDIVTSPGCRTSSLRVSAPGQPTLRYCGSKTRLDLFKDSNSLTLQNLPSNAIKNNFSCEFYVKMPANTTTNCRCGRERVRRVVGGSEVGVGQYPWVAGLTLGHAKKLFCAAVVVTDTHVLTAAHCLTSVSVAGLRVVAAEHNINQHQETPRFVRRVKRVTYHPNHRASKGSQADIVILTLDYPLPLHSGWVLPVCLDGAGGEVGGELAGREGVVAGWGYTSPRGAPATTLQAVRVPILSNSACRATGYGALIKPHMLCAGDIHAGSRDACTGDSGGPLTVTQGGVHTLVGIVSFGYQCALPNWPGVYTRVSSFLDWIREEIRSGVQCA